MATHMTTPSVQLSPSPRAPTRVPTVPPPSIWNVVSSGAIVWPCAYRKMRPRHMRSPPRVTMNDGTPPYATTKPCSPPTAAPSTIPSTSVTTHVNGCSSPSPRLCGIQTAWNIAIVYPRKPSIDPTERSMLRDTMTRTIPVAMIAIEALWTDRFQRLRAVRNVPPDTMPKLTQMMISAATIPSMRVSTSIDRSTPVTGARAERTASTSDRIGGAGWPSVVASPGTETPISSLPRPPSCPSVKTRPAPHQRGRALMTRATNASTAGGDLPGRNALAQIGLRDPASVEDILQVVLGDRVRRQKDRAQAVPTRGLERRRPTDLAWVGVLTELDRSVAGGLAEQPRVLPYIDRLRAERHAVQGGFVAVLAGHRHLAREALCGERGDHPTGHTVVLGEDGIDLVAVRGQDLLHVGLRLRWVPVVR